MPPQGFRCAADPQPVLELDLRGCRVTYKAKRGKKMPHALKVTGTAGEMLVIGFQSRQQAEDWRKVWRCCSLAELCVGRKNGGTAMLGCSQGGWGRCHLSPAPLPSWGCLEPRLAGEKQLQLSCLSAGD